MKDIDLEDVLLVPEQARNLEKEPLEFHEDDHTIDIDRLDTKRSPGMMLEDQGRTVEAQERRMKPGKLEKLHTGSHIVYTEPGQPKICRIGKILPISRAEATVIRPILLLRIRQ